MSLFPKKLPQIAPDIIISGEPFPRGREVRSKLVLGLFSKSVAAPSWVRI